MAQSQPNWLALCKFMAGISKLGNTFATDVNLTHCSLKMLINILLSIKNLTIWIGYFRFTI